MISLPIFTENMKFFAWTFLNSSKIGRWKSFNKSRHSKRGKKKKTWRGCFSQTKWVPKKLYCWMLWYLLFEHLWKTPSCRRKLHPKSEKNVLQISHLFFWMLQGGQISGLWIHFHFPRFLFHCKILNSSCDHIMLNRKYVWKVQGLKWLRFQSNAKRSDADHSLILDEAFSFWVEIKDKNGFT